MRRLTLILFALLLSVASSAGDSPAGRAAFFYLGSTTGEDATIYDDFIWHLNAVSPWLEERGVVVSYHDSVPFAVPLNAHRQHIFSHDDFERDLGVILISVDGNIRIHYGVMTDIELQQLAARSFGLTSAVSSAP